MIDLNCISIIDKVSKALNTDPMSVDIINLWLTHIDNQTGINGIVMVNVKEEYYIITVQTCSSNTIELTDESFIRQYNRFNDYGVAFEYVNNSFSTHHQVI